MCAPVLACFITCDTPCTLFEPHRVTTCVQRASQTCLSSTTRCPCLCSSILSDMRQTTASVTSRRHAAPTPRPTLATTATSKSLYYLFSDDSQTEFRDYVSIPMRATCIQHDICCPRWVSLLAVWHREVVMTQIWTSYSFRGISCYKTPLQY